MIRLVPPLLAASVLAVALPAAADAPPSDALPLSQILQTLEQERHVAWFDEIDWDDDDGYWDIEYVDRNGSVEGKRLLETFGGAPFGSGSQRDLHRRDERHRRMTGEALHLPFRHDDLVRHRIDQRPCGLEVDIGDQSQPVRRERRREHRNRQHGRAG